MEELIQDEISKSLDDNVKYLKEILKDNSDVVFRQFYINDAKAALIYIDGMADKVLLDDFVMRPLMMSLKPIKSLDDIKNRIMTVTDMKDVKKMSESLKWMLSGETIMLIEGIDVSIIIANRSWVNRGVGEPSAETLVRGSREGLTETIRFNTALIRRRIRDTRLRMKPTTVGKRSKTDVVITYIDDIVNKDILSQVEQKIDNINIDAILDSGYIEQLIEDNSWSIFPQIQSTERPDVVAAALFEGRVAVLVDNSPFAIIVPATLPSFFQSPDDYNQRWIYASVIRIMRIIAILIAMVLPALYVAVTSFHTNIIPTKLAYSIAGSREGVPFPAFIEALIMEVSLGLLLEAVVRLPKPIGATIGIVGGIIIGQAAVSAGIVSPIMIIIVSLTAITSFITPNYSVTWALRLVRLLLIIAAAIIGLYGIMLGLIVLIIHLARLKSFGIPYLAPAANPNAVDYKDLYIRAPFQYFKTRPQFLNTGDKVRQK
ncbi:MAG: spore germination protein [Bacillota bacterium]|nr:spore germination protein [Bacillota bacterium]